MLLTSYSTQQRTIPSVRSVGSAAGDWRQSSESRILVLSTAAQCGRLGVSFGVFIVCLCVYGMREGKEACRTVFFSFFRERKESYA